jgi:YVTN family beta-propeller protein
MGLPAVAAWRYDRTLPKAGLSSPTHIAVHGRELFVVDKNNNRVKVLDRTAGTTIRTIDTLCYPYGIAIDPRQERVRFPGAHTSVCALTCARAFFPLISLSFSVSLSL